MASRGFSEAYGRLVGAFRRYHDAPRQPERVAELAQARATLDDARTETRAQRGTKLIDPPTPDSVEPGLGTDPRSQSGKVAAVLFGMIMIFVTVAMARSLTKAEDTQLDFVDGTVTESVVTNDEGACTWNVQADLRNNTDRRIVILSASANTSFGQAQFTTGGLNLEAHSATPVVLSFPLQQGCPGSVDELGAGQIRFHDLVLTDP